jgi:hypothetical protein
MEDVEAFLKKIAPKLKVNPKDFIIYTFRHSAFTHEIVKNEKDLITIANEGGTSIGMLSNHYYSYVS